jgi:GNAT superfamily N-acetyltransferase
VIRRLTEDDVPAVVELMFEAFEAYDRAQGLPLHPRPPVALAAIRPRHLIRTDPDGAWGAEEDGRLVCAGLALKREGLWGLSLLVTDPGCQSRGIGTAVLQACHAYAEDARGRIILSSTDPRALRAYARLGLRGLPSLAAVGAPRGVAAPEGVREGGRGDLPLTEAVDRHVRGAAHGPDIGALLDMHFTLLVAERGYAFYGADGDVRMVAACDEATARELLHAIFARLGEVRVQWLTADQQWAIRACVDAGLELRTNEGAVFLGGDVGPFHPYLPHGAFL